MQGQVPEFKRCCFCLPLRRGLIAWGYTKLVLNVLALIYFVFVAIWWSDIDAFSTTNIVVLTLIYICLLTDLSFEIVFIVGGHKKSVKLLKIIYIYNLVWLAVMLLGISFFLFAHIRSVCRMWEHPHYRIYLLMDVLPGGGLVFSILFAHIYSTLLIRSEIKKLQNQSLEMQFSNQLAAGESHCTLQNV